MSGGPPIPPPPKDYQPPEVNDKTLPPPPPPPVKPPHRTTSLDKNVLDSLMEELQTVGGKGGDKKLRFGHQMMALDKLQSRKSDEGFLFSIFKE